MKRDELMLAQLGEVFIQRKSLHHFAGCIDVRHDSVLHVIEVETTHENDKKVKRSAYQTTDNHQLASFRIKNSTQKQIHLVAIDGCCFNSADPPRCDCIVFDDVYFCFVELKLNVEEFKQRSEKAKDARRQLGAMIDFLTTAFRKANKDFRGYRTEAYVVMQQDKYPRSSSRNVIAAERFFNQYGVELFEKNEKEF